MLQGILIILASLGVIEDPNSDQNQNDPKGNVEQHIGPAGGGFDGSPDVDEDEDSKHSTKEGI